MSSNADNKVGAHAAPACSWYDCTQRQSVLTESDQLLHLAWLRAGSIPAVPQTKVRRESTFVYRGPQRSAGGKKADRAQETDRRDGPDRGPVADG